MTDIEFMQLCRDIGQVLQPDRPTILCDEGEIKIDGVNVALFFDAENAPDLVCCYVDLGEICQENRAEAYQALLTMNLLSGTKTTGVYSIDPESGNAIFIVQFPDPADLDGALRAELFRLYAAQAAGMRGAILAGEAPDPATVRAFFPMPGAGMPMANLA
ncbi:MAG: hypothetical protein ACO1N5_14470 [Noviherbaspirillum sp.]